MGVIRYLKNRAWYDRYTRQAIDEINQTISTERLQRRIDYLREKTLNSTQSGVSNEKYCEHELIVSLTSFGKRIYDVYLAIESIMQGTIKPNRIILWLAENEFKGKMLPRTLQLQQFRGLEILFCEDMRSYNKLIPSLKHYPNACVITIDDDVMYEYDIVERLVNSYLENPNAICACRIHKLTFDKEHKLNSYMNWAREISMGERFSPYLFPTGVGGVLYPPHCLSEEVFNKDIFMEICPYADDVWFYSMALLNNTPITQVYTGKPKGYYMQLPSSLIDALSLENTNPANCRNDVQIKAVFEKYNLYDKLL